ncbi:nucleoplasmin-like isoform X2 [Polypterus senegalus]|uniref:nucleoplasmin-like isoform X2 n=1 Tax=Polypterus senegalus TaxID=55291 RepID=UPI001962D89D|nr:nucleoplasmin-like isoform X2 [Polypterus senegalus]
MKDESPHGLRETCKLEAESVLVDITVKHPKKMDCFDISSLSSLTKKPVCVMWGCILTGNQRQFVFEVNDLLEHQLFIKTICLDAAAKDELHVVEVQSMITGKSTPIPIASLKPLVMPMVSLYGLEVNLPVTFNLRSGGGPVYIYGQHIINDSEEAGEEESHEHPGPTSFY